ncbi:unnamed protein product [Symbiodinium pilosum]|uniref:PPPDE domain-containing protein n=1 Tax=Symbiodinium pilosum TaxID=2952 RepID=A0A812WGI6_SYMPI|nr:unnamed protein product [Symbiodinium pilosum]
METKSRGETKQTKSALEQNGKPWQAVEPAHQQRSTQERSRPAPQASTSEAPKLKRAEDLRADLWVRNREAMVPEFLVDLRPSASTEVFVGDVDEAPLFDGEVKLQVYHLAKAVKAIGLPIYHTGVEVYGLEHYYCVNGVEWCWPRGYGQGVHKAAVPLGKTKLNKTRVEQVIKKMKPKWPGQDYKLLSHNCQTFAVELVSLLLPGVVVPSEYCRFAGTKPKASKPVLLARQY